MCFNLMECVLTNGIVKNLSNVCFTVSTVCRVKWHALLLDVFFHLQVFDYDFGLQDDFMGSAYLYLESLEHQRSSDVLWRIWNTISSVVISITLLWHCCPLVFIYIYIYIMYKYTNAVVRDVEPNDWVWQDFGCSCCRFSLPFRTLDVTLDLKDPHYPNHDLGSLELAVTLIPKEGDFREAVSFYFWLCLCFSSWCVWTELWI